MPRTYSTYTGLGYDRERYIHTCTHVCNSLLVKPSAKAMMNQPEMQENLLACGITKRTSIWILGKPATKFNDETQAMVNLAPTSVASDHPQHDSTHRPS